MSVKPEWNPIRDVSLREVLDAFLSVEVAKDQYAHYRDEYLRLSSATDEELIAFARKFANERLDTNPFLIYTVGVRGQSWSELVKKWILAEVPLGSLYTLGINPSMTNDLVSVGWNLKLFAHLLRNIQSSISSVAQM